MNLVERVGMADSQRLDALLDQVVEWQALAAAASTPTASAPAGPTAMVSAPAPKPRASRKRARASLSQSPSPSQPSKRREQTSMHLWQEEAAKLWEKRAEAIAASNAGLDKPMASWQKRKMELQSLRAEAKQLEEQLRMIQDGTEPSIVEAKRRREQQRMYTEIAWRLAEERAREQKEAALAENSRLKGLVQSHLELSRVLQPALFQDSTTSLPRQARLQSSVERSALFASMDEKLSASLPNVKSAVRRLVGASGNARDKAEVEPQGRVVGVNTAHPVGSIQRHRTFPFGADDVVSAHWDNAQRGFPDVATRTHETEVLSPDALGLDVIVNPAEGEQATIRLRGVLKRCTTTAGLIAQFGGIIEWQVESSGTTAVTEQYAWSVTRAMRANPRGSVLQGSLEATLMTLSAPSGADPELGGDYEAAHDFMEQTAVPALRRMLDRIDQATENGLLDAHRLK